MEEELNEVDKQILDIRKQWYEKNNRIVEIDNEISELESKSLDILQNIYSKVKIGVTITDAAVVNLDKEYLEIQQKITPMRNDINEKKIDAYKTLRKLYLLELPYASNIITNQKKQINDLKAKSSSS